MKIEPTKTNLKELFSGEDKQYMVPVYQRDYSWKIDQVRQLWDDILTAYETSSDYFMGPFVLNSEEHETDEYDIVDGQQRLATFTLLFAAIQQYVKHYLTDRTNEFYSEWELTPKNKETADSIVDIAGRRIGWALLSQKYYIKLNRKDEVFCREKILNRTIPPICKSDFSLQQNTRILEKAYITFCEYLKDRFIKRNNGLEELKLLLNHTVTKLWFLRISVESSHDAYLLFEGLNHKGMNLSVADLLKNKFLMTCEDDSDLKERVLEKWDLMSSTIEQSRFDLAEYIRVYWAAFHSPANSPVSKKQLYGEIKKHITKSNIEHFTDKLFSTSEFFVEMTRKDLTFPSSEYAANTVESTFAEINELKYSVCYPLLLATHRFKGDLLPSLAKRILNYLFRVVTIEEISVGRAKQAMNQAMACLKDKQSDETILSKLSEPEDTNAHFMGKIERTKIESNYVAKYFLSKLYAHELGNEVCIHRDEVHLEHILPVKNEAFWPDFKPKVQSERNDYVYNIGNMTLLSKGLNQKIQNKSFSSKIEYYKERFNEADIGTQISMTYQIHKDFEDGNTEWTSCRISERATSFAEKAKDIW